MTGIGSKELISFPDESIVGVAAKIDTGADYSAVWASDVAERDGELRFKLFGKGSQFYTGKSITATEYGITEVKNSFGHSEQRYKVTLPVRIAGRKIRAEFRLADRSNNRYPVLIGKKTLSRKFFVDVSINNTVQQKYKILVLNSKPSKSVASFFDTLNSVSRKVSCDFRLYDDLSLTFDTANGIGIIDAKTHMPLVGYDMFYFKTYFDKAEMASALVEYAQMYNINFADSEVASYRALTKISQYARMARFGIAIPSTIIVSPAHVANDFQWLKSKLGMPFILKDAAADKGENNFLIRTELDFKKATKNAKESHTYFVAQKFIPNAGDYRIIVLDKKVSLIIHRKKTTDKTHLNNTSTGGKAVIITPNELPSAAIGMAVSSAIVMKREVAGVDVIQDTKTGEWMILEVNNSPQIASGAYPDEKVKIFDAFLRKYAGK